MNPHFLLVAIGAGLAYLVFGDKKSERNATKNDLHGNHRRRHRKPRRRGIEPSGEGLIPPIVEGDISPPIPPDLSPPTNEVK